ncbi:major facilitator superfamily domain-containing protein [Catenaria anguillulae PL171]|uniref:Lysosomal dipeptide transporter MFSD1 n=1 Tax=Catenaria anguillulae PL171 TaxID=765915 RepID=A0A1Y2H841_9FUNG|nr:major facilitator superfamily domain-containing protein [Catenaria anguillulae PL171]
MTTAPSTPQRGRASPAPSSAAISCAMGNAPGDCPCATVAPLAHNNSNREDDVCLELRTQAQDQRANAPLGWRLFAFSCTLLIGFGSHYSAHVVSALKASIKADLGINNAQYGVLQAAVSLVNTIIPVIGGRFIDTFGVSNGSIVSCTLIMLGGLLFALSAHAQSFALMVMGRLLYGLGSMTVITVQHTILAHWFRGTALAVTVGVQIATSRLASFLATLVTVPIKNVTGWYGYSLWVAFVLCLASWIIDVIYVAGMRKFYRLPTTTNTNAVAPSREGDHAQHPLLAPTNHIRIDSSLDLPTSSSSTAHHHSSPAPLHAPRITQGDAGLYSVSELAKIRAKTAFNLSDVYLFPMAFWLVAGLSFTLGSAWTAFLHIAPELIMQRFHQPEALAAFNASLGQLLPVFGAPGLGYLMDKYGRRPEHLVGASVALLASFVLLSLAHWPPYIALLLFSMSLTTGPVAMVSAVGLLIGPKSMGTALGIYKSLTNIASTLLDPTLGWLQDISGGYTWPLAVLVAVTVLALVFSVGLWVMDAVESGVLSADAKERPAILNRMENGQVRIRTRRRPMRREHVMGDEADEEGQGEGEDLLRPSTPTYGTAQVNGHHGPVISARRMWWGRFMLGLMAFFMVLGWAVCLALLDPSK